MVINVILNYVCILKFGYQAAAYTTAVSYFILLVFQGYLEHKITGQRIIPLKKSVVISIVYFALNMVTMVLFQCKWYVRYGVVVAGVLVALKWLGPQLLQVLMSLKKK